MVSIYIYICGICNEPLQISDKTSNVMCSSFSSVAVIKPPCQEAEQRREGFVWFPVPGYSLISLRGSQGKKSSI